MNKLYTIRNMLSQGKSIFDLKLRVTYYARVSTDKDEQLNSLENQVLFFDDYIKKNSNWIFVSGYIDEGLSGTSVKKRINFQKMICDAENDTFDLILTKEISRFSRNTVDSIQYTQKLLYYGVGIYFLNDNLNTFDMDSELRLTIMSSIAQEEVRRLSDRVRFGYNRSVEKGIVAGSSNILGYKKNKGKLVIIEKEAEVVRLIFSEYSKGKMGTEKLGHYLYDRYGITGKTGKPLAPSVIIKMIRNPKYKGFYSAKLDTKIDYQSNKRIKIKDEDRVVYKDNNSCPPIVNEELWDRCNEILNKNCTKYHSGIKDSKYSLSGKIKCFHDGATFIRGKRYNKNSKEPIIYWGCSNYRKYGRMKKNGCATPIIKYDFLFSIFKNIFDNLIYYNNEIIQDVYNLIKTNIDIDDYRQSLNDLENKSKRLINMKMNLIDMRIKNEITTEEFLQLKKKYDREMDILMKKKQVFLLNEKEKNNRLDFQKFVDNVIMSFNNNKETVFNIISTIINKILVERVTSKNNIILHIYFNIYTQNDTSVNLSDFLLLFHSSK